MGRIANLLSFIRTVRNGAQVTDVKVDPGGGPNITGENFQGAGEDAYPLKTDYPYISDDSGTGRESVLGYVDPVNTPTSQEGEKRIYARDPSNGAVIVEVWLRNDGTAIVFNDKGSVTLSPDGSVDTVTTIVKFFS